MTLSQALDDLVCIRARDIQLMMLRAEYRRPPDEQPEAKVALISGSNIRSPDGVQ